MMISVHHWRLVKLGNILTGIDSVEWKIVFVRGFVVVNRPPISASLPSHFSIIYHWICTHKYYVNSLPDFFELLKTTFRG